MPPLDPQRRIPTLVFVVALIFGALAKLWRVGDLWLEAAAVDGFRWLPVGIGAELLVAGVFAALVGRVARLHVVVGVVFGVLLLALELFWLALNDVSFRVSQIGISYSRLRGDEGIAIADFNLMAGGDVVPAVVFALIALVLAAAAVALVLRRGTVLSRRMWAALTGIGLVVTLSDVVVFSEHNFGMGESPVTLIARTYVRAFFGYDEVKLPRTVPTPTTRAGRMELLKAQQPQPPSTTPTRDSRAIKNGILFFSEGIARKQTGLEGGGATTPNLMKALQEQGGLDFEHYYAPYHKSIAAIYSMTCSDWPPPNAMNIIVMNPRIDCGALPEVLSKGGIHPGLFHGGDFGFYDKLQLLGNRGFEIQKDARSIAGKDIWEYNWGVDDRAVVDSVLAWIDSLPAGERFFAVIIPITAHYPYAIPPDVTPAFPGTTGLDRFSSAVHFLDEAFGRLNEGLKARGLSDDTALLYMADHGETVAERPRAQAGRRLAYEPSLHVPFAIIAPAAFPTWQKSARMGSHVDLLPTILDLMGLPPDPRHHGQSLLADQFEDRRIFIGANNGPKYVGFVDGRQKFILNRSTGLQELYDLDKDPFEQDNLARRDREKVARLSAEVLAFSDAQLEHLKNAPAIGADVDVQLGVLETAKVRVIKRDGTTIECPRDDAAGVDVDDLTRLPFRRSCPGMLHQPFLGYQHYKTGLTTKACVLVNVPDDGGTLEIEVGAQPWLPFFTRVRAAVNRKVVAEDDVAGITVFGDGKQGQNRRITQKKQSASVRVAFPSSSREVRVQVSGTAPLRGPICLTLDEKAWRGNPGGKEPKGDDDEHERPPHK
ncbi:MAG: sulfatase-like hydrolase/transferase [Deltaproteobacteria bacterium]|nr:sulfatase-like hydrolase/transferase [Deltaproteobacteria bacterium]